MPTITALDLTRPEPIYQTIANPGAGASITLNWNTLEFKILTALSCTFTADANVANRFITLTFNDGTRILYTSAMTTAILANEIILIGAAVEVPYIPQVALRPSLTIPLPKALLMPFGSTITISAANVQAGDTFTTIGVFYHSWLMAP